MMRFNRVLAYLALVLALFAGVGSAAARSQPKSVTVERRDGDITILQNGDVQVVETWVVHFIGGPFQYAFRSIPLNRVVDITDWGVSEGGTAYREDANRAPGTFSLLDKDGEQKITWYFAPTTDATRTFQLRYTLKGALRIYDEGDQFFWKFIESDRAYAIQSATVVVHLPGTFSLDELRAVTYYDAEEAAGEASLRDGSTVVFSGGPFPGGTEWEIRAQWPHGAVDAQPPAWQRLEDIAPLVNLGFLCLAGIIVLGGFGGLYLLWYRRGRDPVVPDMPAQITRPPEDLPPGLVGTLLDEKADMADILATMVDLARRGYMRFVESKQGLFRSKDFEFERLRDDVEGLRPYEALLLRRIFESKSRRRLSDLREKFYTAIPKLKKAMYAEVVERGYFPDNPNVVRAKYIAIGVTLLIVSGVCTFFVFPAIAGGVFSLLIAPLMALDLVFIGLAVVGYFMPRKTEQGARAAVRWKAFRRYLQEIDRYTNLEAASDLYEEYLPYAIAFGLEKSWTKKFSALEAVPAPRWYVPYGLDGHPYYAGHGGSSGGHLASGLPVSHGTPSLDGMAGGALTSLDSISDGLFGMLNSAGRTFSSAPSSSGGGGFSGGGGGGGGGGSSGFG